jgi:nucleoside-diphosphate-sugar epimerase
VNIIIIGSEGFIGGHLVNHFRLLGHEVFGCDIKAPSQIPNYLFIHNDQLTFHWNNLFEKYQFDICINAGGNGDIQQSILNPAFDYDSNVGGTFNILEAIRQKNKTCIYVHLSSAAVYGNPDQNPVSENATINPISPYGRHKYLSEKLCLEYSQLYGIRSIILRPFSIFGPGLRKQIFWDVYQKYKQHHSQIELWGTGEESRDFLYIDEFVSIVDFLIRQDLPHTEIYNVGTGVETTILEAVSNLCKYFAHQPTIHFNGKIKAGDPIRWRADVTKLKNLGYHFTQSYLTGVQVTSSWLMSHG